MELSTMEIRALKQFVRDQIKKVHAAGYADAEVNSDGRIWVTDDGIDYWCVSKMRFLEIVGISEPALAAAY